MQFHLIVVSIFLKTCVNYFRVNSGQKLALPKFSPAAQKIWVAQNLGGLQPPSPQPASPPCPYAYDRRRGRKQAYSTLRNEMVLCETVLCEMVVCEMVVCETVLCETVTTQCLRRWFPTESWRFVKINLEQISSLSLFPKSSMYYQTPSWYEPF